MSDLETALTQFAGTPHYYHHGQTPSSTPMASTTLPRPPVPTGSSTPSPATTATRAYATNPPKCGSSRETQPAPASPRNPPA